LYGSYRTILPLKDYPKVPSKLIHGEGKGKIWKFNESSALFKSLVENLALFCNQLIVQFEIAKDC